MPGREWTVENGRSRRSLVMLANASIRRYKGCRFAMLWTVPLSRRRFVVSPRLDTRFRGYDMCWL